jgi:hypothetical protein
MVIDDYLEGIHNKRCIIDAGRDSLDQRDYAQIKLPDVADQVDRLERKMSPVRDGDTEDSTRLSMRQNRPPNQ